MFTTFHYLTNQYCMVWYPIPLPQLIKKKKETMPHQYSTTDPHVAILAFPFSSHAPPLFNMIRRLATAAPNIQFSFFNTSQSNNTFLSAYKKQQEDKQPNIKLYDVWDGVPEGYVFAGKRQEDIELFMKAAPESLRRAVEVAVVEIGREVSCLVSDGFLYFAKEIAEEMGVPWVPFWCSGINSLSAHLYTDLIRDTIGIGGFEGREDQTLKFISGMSKVRVRDLPEGVVFGNLDSIFSRMLHQMGLVLPEATAVLINSFEELDPIITNDLNSKLNKVLHVRSLNSVSPPPTRPAPDTTGCLSWLDKQEAASVAYVSCGSVATPPPNELAALAEALEASGVPFIWSLRDNLKVHLPNGFLDKTKVHGMVVPWAPQLDILAHGAVGVYVSHCGWSSILESVAAGVPMICRPFFGDQRMNGRLVEEVWEVGVNVEGGVFTKKGVMNSLDQILFQDKGKAMREKMKALKGVLEKADGPKGSSTENFKMLLELVSRTKAKIDV